MPVPRLTTRCCVHRYSMHDPKVVEVYTAVGKILSRHRAGQLPKAFKIIPNLRNWEDILFLTTPESWSPQAMFAVRPAPLPSALPLRAALAGSGLVCSAHSLVVRCVSLLVQGSHLAGARRRRACSPRTSLRRWRSGAPRGHAPCIALRAERRRRP